MDLKLSRSEKIKKSVAAVVCCGLCVSTGLLGSIAVTKMPEINGRTAFANGHVYLQDTTDSVEFYDVDESFFAPDDPNHFTYSQAATERLMPGDTRTGSIKIANNANSDKVEKVTISLFAASTGQMGGQKVDGVPKEFVDFYNANKSLGYTPAQLKSLSDDLVKKLKLTIKQGDDLVYSGPLTGDGDSNNKKMTQITPIEVGTLKPTESVTYDFTLEVPTTIDNDYANAAALIDWVFVVSDWSPVQPPPSSSEPEPVSSEPVSSEPPPATTTQAPPAPPSPGTGEAAFPYTMGAVFCGLSALVIFFIAFGNIDKKAKEMLEDE